MIRIDKKYVIDVDNLNYTAKIDNNKTVTDKNGKERASFTIIGYYTTLRSAVRAILEYEVKNKLSKGEKSLNEAITELDKAINKLDKVIGKIPKEDRD